MRSVITNLLKLSTSRSGFYLIAGVVLYGKAETYCKKSSEGSERTNKTLLVPHGVIFFYDESHPDIIVPVHDNESMAKASNTCVSIVTMVDVDGEVAVELANQIAEPRKENMLHVFEGVIDAPGFKIGMSTSDADILMEVKVSQIKAKLSVWIDDPNFPAVVLVEAK